MKKRSIKNLNLNKKSISNLSKNELKGGTIIPTVTIISCISCFVCPTRSCTEGVLCDMIRTEEPFR
jgi:hypothetical protein